MSLGGTTCYSCLNHVMGVPVSKPIYINAHHVPLLLFSENRLELEKLLARLHLGLYLLWSLNQTTAGLVREPSGSITGTQLPPIPATNPQVVGVLLPQFTSAHTIQSSKEWKKPHVLSLLSSRRARRRTQGTTGQSASPLSSWEGDRAANPGNILPGTLYWFGLGWS